MKTSSCSFRPSFRPFAALSRRWPLSLLALLATAPAVLAQTTRDWTAGGPHPTWYFEAANWNPSSAARG